MNQLGFGNIAKIVATRCHILQLKCTKFDFGWAPIAGFEGPYFYLRGREGTGGEGREGRGWGRGRGKEGREGRDPCFWVTPPEN